MPRAKTVSTTFTLTQEHIDNYCALIREALNPHVGRNARMECVLERGIRRVTKPEDIFEQYAPTDKLRMTLQLEINPPYDTEE